MSLTGPANQPPVQPQPSGTPGYPQPGQPGPAGYAPPAFAPPPKKGISPLLLAVIVLAGVLTVVVPGFFIVNGLSGHGLNPFVDRHGLPNNVPLPSGASFQFMDKNGTSSTTGDWYWTVASPNNADTLRSFYQSNLGSNGWTINKTLGSNGDYEFMACQGNQSLDVEMVSGYSVDVLNPQGNQPKEIFPPSGGAVLRISLESGCGS